MSPNNVSPYDVSPPDVSQYDTSLLDVSTHDLHERRLPKSRSREPHCRNVLWLLLFHVQGVNTQMRRHVKRSSLERQHWTSTLLDVWSVTIGRLEGASMLDVWSINIGRLDIQCVNAGRMERHSGRLHVY